jgi:hypothetical protein
MFLDRGSQLRFAREAPTMQIYINKHAHLRVTRYAPLNTNRAA